jgi:hypothetical protein
MPFPVYDVLPFGSLGQSMKGRFEATKLAFKGEST